VRSDGDEVPPVCELDPGAVDGVLAGRLAVCEVDPGVDDGVLPSGGGVGVAGAFGVARRRWVSSVPGVWVPVLPPVDGVAGVLGGRFMVDGDVPVKPLDGIEVEPAVEVVAGRPCDHVPADPVPIDEAPYGLEPGVDVLGR
jgi:hypothetical protein